MSEALKGCPFCNGEAWSFPSQYADVTLWNARCKKCYAAHDGYKTQAEAIAAWNRRAPDPAAEALARALEKCGMRLTSTNPLLSQTWAYSQETIETTQRLNRETLDEARAALAAYEEAK